MIFCCWSKLCHRSRQCPVHVSALPPASNYQCKSVGRFESRHCAKLQQLKSSFPNDRCAGFNPLCRWVCCQWSLLLQPRTTAPVTECQKRKYLPAQIPSVQWEQCTGCCSSLYKPRSWVLDILFQDSRYNCDTTRQHHLLGDMTHLTILCYEAGCIKLSCQTVPAILMFKDWVPSRLVAMGSTFERLAKDAGCAPNKLRCPATWSTIFWLL